MSAEQLNQSTGMLAMTSVIHWISRQDFVTLLHKQLKKSLWNRKWRQLHLQTTRVISFQSMVPTFGTFLF